MAVKQTVRKSRAKTPTKPRPKSGPGAMNGAETGVPFSKENQPSAEAKSEGWKRKKFSRDVIKEMLNMPYKFTKDSKIKEQLVESFGKDVLEMSIGEIMTLQQANKAIKQGDTNAYNTIVNQGLGFPKQQTDVTTNGKDLPAGQKQTIEVSLSI